MATTENVILTEITYDYSDYYAGSNQSENEVCDRTSTMTFGAIITPLFFSIVVIFSLFGNILVIVILTKYENVKSLNNALILNLAVSDLLFTAGLPFWANYHMYGWTLGEPACRIVTYVFNVGFYSSGILLILMTVQRYVAVMKPLSNIVSPKGIYSVLASLVIWVVSALVAIPAFKFTKVINEGLCQYENSFGSLWGIYQQNVLFLLSSAVFIFCYSQIICRLLRPTAQRRKTKTLKLIFTLMVVFFLGWAPYNIVIFLQSFYLRPQPAAEARTVVINCGKLKELDYAFYITRFLAFSHCCLNPVFYVFMGVKYKNHLKKMLKSLGRNNSTVRKRQRPLTITSITSELSL